MAIAAERAAGRANPFAHLINDDNYMWWAAAPVILGMFIVIMDSSIVNVALSPMMSAFGSNVDEIEWVSTAYMLASAIMMPTTAFLGERFGRKKLYALAIFLFTVTSMLCGMAWSVGSLVFFRILQGIVGGAIQPVAQAIIFEAFPAEKRGMSMALVGIGAMFAPMFGPTLGGYLVDYLDWRWIFYVNLPFGLFATFLAVFVLRESKTRLVNFDAWGFGLMAIFLTTLLLGVSEGNVKGWGSDYIVALLAVSAVSFGAFIIVELWRKEPVIDLSLFKSMTYSVGTLVSIVVGIALFGGMFLLPVFLQSMMGYDAVKTGLLMMPQGLALAMMMPIAGALSNKLDPRVPMVAGLCLMGYSLVLQAGMTVETSTTTLIGWTLMRGVGMGLVFPAMNQTVLGAVPIHKIGQASGLFNVTRSIGGTFGIALLSSMLTQRAVFHRDAYGQAAAQSDMASSWIGSVASHLMQNGASAIQAKQQASILFAQTAGMQIQVAAFQDAFYFTAILSFCGILPALFVKKKAQPAGAGAHSHAMMVE